MKSTRNFKRMLIFLALIGIVGFLTINRNFTSLARSNATFQVNARAAIVMEADTGRILYEQNANSPMPPASMSKMMSELLLLESVKAGKSKWDEPVMVSRYAAEVTGSQVGLKQGDQMTLKMMFQAMAIPSANDAAVAVAEHLAGSEKSFVDRMNRKARELGLSKNAYFANASGLSLADLGSYAPSNAKSETMMTSKDVALLARALITQYPESLNVTKMTEVAFPANKLKLPTTNELLPGQAFAYEGTDGFKTGFTDDAGYCFTGTAVRDGKRLITVVMGTQSPDARFTESVKLLDYGYQLTASAK